MSLIRPIPSVLSPDMVPSELQIRVFTAPARLGSATFDIRKVEGVALEGHGNIQTRSTTFKKLRSGSIKTINVHFYGSI